MIDTIDYGFNRVYALILMGIWLSTTMIFLWSIRRNYDISRNSKNLWSFMIIFFWVVGMLFFLMWNAKEKNALEKHT
jgi:glucan phosphoethanolaminetransferase (alkaline phosphatase superfamily)